MAIIGRRSISPRNFYKLRARIVPCWRVVIFSLFIFILPYQLALSESEQRVEYQYDQGGNLIGVKAYTNLGLPQVTALTPGFINRENTSTVLATGINLFGVSVTSNSSEVSILRVESISTETMAFTIHASRSAPIGLLELVFSNALGIDRESIVVAERIPIISTDPNPVILQLGGDSVAVTLEFDRPYLQDQVFDLGIADSRIAEVQNLSITLPAGQTSVSTEISGISAGSTSLQISQLANFLALNIPIFVIENIIPAGTHSAYSQGVGVAVYTDQSFETTTQFQSAPVGVAVYSSQPVDTTSPFVAAPVGVAVYSKLPVTTTSQFVAAPVGVAVYSELPVSTTSQFIATPVGVAIFTGQAIETTSLFVATSVGVNKGPVVETVMPTQVSQGSSATVLLRGANLNLVNSITFSPSTGISQTQPFTVNSMGTELALSLDISASASPQDYLILISTSPIEDYAEVATLQVITP